MHVLFCRPTSEQHVPDGIDLESDTLVDMGVEPLWIRAEWVVDQLDEPLTASLSEAGGPLLLRSWMLLEHDYAWLQETLEESGYFPVNDVYAYGQAHYLPRYYDAVAPWMAATTWTEGTDLDEAWDAAQRLGPGPLLLKDYVKSAKEHPRLMVIPEGIEREQFNATCAAFIEYRGELFEGGLVFRRQLPIAVRGPGVFDEYRQFYWHGEPLVGAAYFDGPASPPDTVWIRELGGRIDSNFFTIDFARLISGEWVVIEVGDGGVSSLPPQLDPRELYGAIFDNLEAA